MEKMYRCARCGSTFSEPDYIADKDPNFEGGVYVTMQCPECGNEDIEEGHECPICGGYTETFACADCREDVRNRFTALLMENFTEDERELIDEMIEEGEL